MNESNNPQEQTEKSAANRREVFPLTRWTWIDGARSDDDQYMKLLETYYRPMEVHMGFLVHRYRLREEALELVHDFLDKRKWWDKTVLDKVHRDRGGRFRSFIKACLSNFVIEKLRRSGREIRESDLPLEQMPVAVVEAESADATDEAFARVVWERCLSAVEGAFARQGRRVFFHKIKPHLECRDDAPSYADIARDLTLSGTPYEENAVKQAVFKMRRSFRDLLVSEASQLVGDPGEGEKEARHLLTLVGRATVLERTVEELGFEKPPTGGPNEREPS